MTRRRSIVIALLAAICVTVLALTALAAGKSDVARARAELAEVRQATSNFHDTDAAEGAEYFPFLECFEDVAGGMGQHYVNQSLMDGVAAANEPEALVYEVRPNGELKLVAVEYIVPDTFVPDPLNPPRLFGQDFTHHPELPIYKLHAWIWQANPAGVFSDWNPNVGACP